MIFLYFSVESSFTDAEDFCGGLAVVARFRQCIYDGLFFQLIERDAG